MTGCHQVLGPCSLFALEEVALHSIQRDRIWITPWRVGSGLGYSNRVGMDREDP